MPRHIGSPLVVQPWKRFLAVQAVASGLSNSICSFFPWTTSKGDFASYPQGCLPSPRFNPSFKRPRQKYKTIGCISCHLHRPIPAEKNIKKHQRKLLTSCSNESWVFLVPLPDIWILLLGKHTFLSAIHASFFLLLPMVFVSI